MIKEQENLDKRLSDIETKLKAAGYKKKSGHAKSEDFGFWQTFYVEEKKAYQIGILFYDWRKYLDRNASDNKIVVQYECMLICETYSRVDLSVCDENMDAAKFEAMAAKLHEMFGKQFELNTKQ